MSTQSSPWRCAFMDMEDAVCDIASAVELLQLAVNDGRPDLVGLAFDTVMERAKKLKVEWCARHKRAVALDKDPDEKPKRTKPKATKPHLHIVTSPPAAS